MSSRERYSLPLLEFPPVPTIDSSTFLGYLFQEFPDSKNFSARLDLSWLTPVIDFVYQQKIAVDRYAGEERQLLERHDPEKAKKQAPAERGTVFYYDPDTDNYQISPIEHGSFTSVKSSIVEVGSSGKMPLIRFHTHPIVALPSPMDYSFMVLQSGTSARFINAIMVLCPQMQILALATPQTPFLSDSDIITVSDQFQNDLEQDSKTIELRQQEAAIIENHLAQVGELAQRIYRTHTQNCNNQKEITPELENQIFIDYNEQVKPLDQELKARLGPAHLEFLNHGEKTLNEALIRVARLWHIQLYSSTDRSQFTKFSS